MIENIKLNLPDGSVMVPSVQLKYDDTHVLSVVGFDTDMHGDKRVVQEHPEFVIDEESTYEKQSPERKKVLLASLQNVCWDFENYPNPYVAILRLLTQEQILVSTFPVDTTAEGYNDVTGNVDITLGWYDTLKDRKYPQFMTTWPGIPSWLDIIDWLIVVSREHEVPFNDILEHGCFFQWTRGFAFRMPIVVREYAYNRFKGSIKK